MKFIIGSQYFFRQYPGFKSHDSDFIELLDTDEFKKKRIIRGQGKDIIQLKKKSKEALINDALHETLAMCVGKFLIPEFNKAIGFTIDDLPKLQPLIDRLDEKHLYEKIIYDSYLENNNFILKDIQRDAAYESYRRARS